MTNPLELRKFLMPEIIYGVGAIDLVGRYTANLGGRKALVVTDPGVTAAGWAGRVEANLKEAGIALAVFDQLTPNPKDFEVMAGAEVYRAEQCDVIIAVGGGSPLDCAKGIGIVVTNGQHVLAFEGVDQIPVPGPPLICLPTTAGSSADVSQFAIITDTARQVKIAIISRTMVPDVALIDPQTTISMPPALTAATGMDAFTHAIEAYVSNASSPLTDLDALEAIRLAAKHLRGAVHEPENMDHRHGMMLSSLLAGLAFSNASLGLVHAMAHSLGGYLDLPHGECNSILLEHVLQFNFDAAPDRYRTIGQLLGLPPKNSTPAALVEIIADFRRQVGISQRLADIGVLPAAIPQLAQNAFNDPCLATNPIQPTPQEIEAIYERAL